MSDALANRELVAEALQTAARKRAEAHQRQDEANELLAEWLPRALDAGLSITWIAENAGMTRQGVYDAMRRLNVRRSNSPP